MCPLYPRGCPFYPQGVSYSSPPCPDNPQGEAQLVTGDEPVPLPYNFNVFNCNTNRVCHSGQELSPSKDFCFGRKEWFFGLRGWMPLFLKPLTFRTIMRRVSSFAGYDLFSTYGCVVPSFGTGVVETDVAIATFEGMCARVPLRTRIGRQHAMQVECRW